MDWKERLKSNAESARNKDEQHSPQQHAAFMAEVREAFEDFKEEVSKLDDGYSGDFGIIDTLAKFHLNHGSNYATFSIRIGAGAETPFIFMMERPDGNNAAGGWRIAPDKDKILQQMAELISFLHRT